MHRRTFLTRFPVGLAGAVATALSGRSDEAQIAELRPLLERAEAVHFRAHALYHEPWRWGEIRELLQSVSSTLAQVWLKARGITDADIEGRPGRGNWFWVACARRDEDTRIPWRQMHLHMARMGNTVDHIEKFYSKKISLQMRAQFIEDHRRLVRAALDTNALCLEGVRREVLHRLPADQVVPNRVV
jgi:hypothetical protein